MPLANWAARIEAGDSGDWDSGGDLYTVGKPMGSTVGSGAAPMRGKALDYLGEKTRKVEPRRHHGRQTPTVYVLGRIPVPIEDMPWLQRAAMLEKDRERHPVREGVQAKPYNVPIDPMPPVVDRIARDDEAEPDTADRGNVVPMERRRTGR